MLSLTATLLSAIFCTTLTEEVNQERSKPYIYGRVVLLAVGIEQYQHGALSKAPAAENDARTLSETLAAQYGYEAESLVGPQATKEAILKRIKSLGEELTGNDALIVFFAGHGRVINLDAVQRAGYLLPYDARLNLDIVNHPQEWEDQAINMKGLMDLTRKFKAKHVLLMIDACQSGFMAGRGTNLLFQHDLIQLLTMPSRVVLTATNEVQLARTRNVDGREHGIFTAALLKALETKKPRSTEAKSVLDLVDEIRPAVSDDSDGMMTPDKNSFAKAGEGMNGEFVFLPLTIDPAEIAEAIEDAKRIPKAAKSAAAT